ncbi:MULTISPECIES: hypothetical protein [unclassified Marinobacter]|uniref:hypothetical protein n=1 Tax=unclassified Marinobacter TaxID=83889 RepID=UPI00200FFB26|nr:MULTISPECIES: hypothetical protein [unclassified Marinobacter]UQG55522.1 hypothetical protein MIH16_19365 [Marinobacter sp. M4C]UQG64326.1 hypothetical protein MIH17_19360 [Marinobacter sp. M2C]UQG68605.1 hypothetical protein MIH19_19370 [Marinobacter sp. M1C]
MSFWRMFLAVFLANTLSCLVVGLTLLLIMASASQFYASSLEAEYQAMARAFEQIGQSLVEPFKPPTASEIKARDRARQRETNERIKKRMIVDKNREMCNFWTSEYLNDKTAQNEMYKRSACQRLRQSSLL